MKKLLCNLETKKEENKFLELIANARYIPLKNRNKKFWKIYIDTLNKMCRDDPVFMRGLFSVIVTEYQEETNGEKAWFKEV